MRRHQDKVAVARGQVEDGDARLGHDGREIAHEAWHLIRQRAQVDLEGAPAVRGARDSLDERRLLEGGAGAVVHDEREAVLLVREAEVARDER